MKSEKTLNVIIINENKTIRNALKLLLMIEYNANILSTFETIDELKPFKESKKVDIIILGINLTNIEKYNRLLNQYKDSQIIVVLNQNDKHYYAKIIKSGFKYCLFVDNIFTELSSILDSFKEENDSRV